MKKLWWRLVASLSLILLLGTGYLLLPQTFLSIDNRLRDFLFILRGPLPTTHNVVIVDIDEKSLKSEGQWPWSRNKISQLLYKLSEAEAGIIGLDIVFSEADRTSPHRFHPNKLNVENYDVILAKTMQETPTVGGYFFNFESLETPTTPLIPAVFIEKGGSAENYIIAPKHLILNIPLIQDALYSSGFFNNTPDEGGMIRHVPLVMRFDSTIYPSLALEMIRIFTNTAQVVINNSNIGVESITLNKLDIPTDRFARLVVNFRGPGKTFKYISATDVLNNNFAPSDVAGKFVFVGTSAVGLADLRATPFDTVMPGVEVHANVVDNMLQGDFIKRSEHQELLDLALMSLIIIITTLFFRYVNAWLTLPLFALFVYGLYTFLRFTLFHEGIVLNIIFPFLALIFSFILSLLIDYITNLHQKQFIMSIFAKKVSQNVMQDLIDHPETALLEPRNKEVTIFFSDIRSFTAISEELDHPERVIKMLNTYMTPMVESITKHKGTIDKFIGDAVMAYWNAPTDVVHHADESLYSALEQIKSLKVLNRTLMEKYGIEIAIGIGIHTGEVTIGEMGSEGRSDYTIIGDNVNLASRLEGLNKMYGSCILISAQTKAQLTDTFNMRALDLVRVKGKKDVVEIFEVLPDPLKEDEIQRYNIALSFYRAKKIDESLVAFEWLQQTYPSTLYKLYIKRCQNALDLNQDDFDPITTMRTK